MVTVVGRNDLGSSLGTGLGGIIGGTLESLAHQRLQKVQQRQHSTGLQALGIPSQAANQIVMLPPEIQGIVVKNFLAGAENQGLNQALGELLGQQSPQGAQPMQAQPQQINGQAVNPIYSKIPQNHPAYVQNNLPEDGQSQQQGKSFAEILKNPRLKPEHRLQIAKLQQQKQISEQKESSKELREEKHRINKETEKYYTETLKADKSAREADDRLNKMEKLVKKGDLPISTFYSIFKNLEELNPAHGAAAGAAIGSIFGGVGSVPGAIIGGGFGSLVSPLGTLLKYAQRKLSPDTEEFEKLSNQFIQGAKAIFGARITDQDLKAYMAQIPTLSNTDEGKLKIIEDMKIANKAEHLRAKAMKEIIRENRGTRPDNLPILVEQRINDQLDELSREFLEA